MKRYIYKFTTLWMVIAALFSTACTDSFEEINTDPDRAKEVPLTNILAFSIRYTSDQLFDPWNDMNEPSSYGGQIAKIQYIDETRYSFRPGTVENKWYYIYRTLNNTKAIEKRAKESGLTNMESVAKIWSTVLFSIATDTWRDVPYTEAGLMDEGILLPKYDKQEDIYPGLLATLKEAADAIASGATDELGAGDVFFDGDMSKWQKFCNSLRLRLALRISAVSPALAKQTVEEILGNPATYPIITSNSDNAFFIWPGESPYIEPWADDSRTRDDHGVSDVLVDLLKELDDPRLPVYAKPGSDNEYRGFTIGATSVVADLSLLSRIGARFRDDFGGFTPYFRAAETYFHIAEATLLGWNTGTTAKEAYEKGVTLSLQENGIEDASDYLAGAAKFDDSLAKLYEQEWLALFKQGMEVWSLYRRTGIPTTHYVAPGSGYTGHNAPPFRYPYPNNEYNLNGANLGVFSGDVKDNFWGKQMWWDQRTGVQ